MRTLFEIDCHSGKDIRQHSMYKKEDEVLLLPARQFRVASCLNVGNGLNIIQVKEVDPSHPLLEPLPMSNPSILAKPLPPSSQIKTKGPYRNPALEETIRRCSSNKVDLKGKQLNDQDMEIITKQAIIGKQCMILDLTYNEVTQHGVSILADALCSNIHLKELNISHNNISDLGVRYLASAMNSCALKRVNLEENDISDEGARYLAEMLTTNTNLLQLSLNHNRIGNYGMNLLANALAHDNTRLELLDLSANTDISDESIDSLVDMIKHNQSLKKLDLRYNDLSANGEKRLQAVAKSKTEFQLWLSHL
jgi:Ran GTPase-activating protein (RanGAP) involved in mRNA processing and transport